MLQKTYNRLAGHSVERIAALSDGIFSVAMTLLVLDVRVPEAGRIHGEQELLAALTPLAPQLLTYLLSFMTLGIFWVGQQAQLAYFRDVDRNLTWIHVAFMAAVVLMPFSTSLLARFITYRTALLLYWLNILILGVIIYASWNYARRAGLTSEEAGPEVSHAINRRVKVAQTLYGFGALLCIVNTYWSIGFIVLVQLYYVFAPRFGVLARIEH